MIYIAESTDEKTGDHFHPQLWGAPFDYAASSSQSASSNASPTMWDAGQNSTLEIALTRHFDGSNFVYADGHAKWQKWGQIWFRDLSRPIQISGNYDRSGNIWAGAFDPRQP